MHRLFFPAFLFCLCALLYAAPPQGKGANHWDKLPNETKQKTLNHQGVEKDVRLVSRDMKAQYDAVGDRSNIYTVKEGQHLRAIPPYVRIIRIGAKKGILKLLHSLAAKKSPSLNNIEEIRFYLENCPRKKSYNWGKWFVDAVRHLPNVRSLHLQGRNLDTIKFIQPLAGQLEFLRLFQVDVKDISVLKHFQKLKTLKMHMVHVEDLSVLAGMQSLRHLEIATSKKSGINSLGQPILASVSLSVEPLVHLKNLEFASFGCFVREDGLEASLAHIKTVEVMIKDPLSEQLKEKWPQKITVLNKPRLS